MCGDTHKVYVPKAFCFALVYELIKMKLRLDLGIEPRKAHWIKRGIKFSLLYRYFLLSLLIYFPRAVTRPCACYNSVIKPRAKNTGSIYTIIQHRVCTHRRKRWHYSKSLKVALWWYGIRREKLLMDRQLSVGISGPVIMYKNRWQTMNGVD